MDRWACVDVPALPLQLLLRREPAWARHPVAVVDENRPQGKVLWVNERALRSRVLPGRRYAEGLALERDLRADVVAGGEVAAAVEELLALLRRFSPEVEPSPGEPGVFWLDAGGVAGLFPSLPVWGREVAASLRARALRGSVVVGFSRFGTYALARSGVGVAVLGDAAAERARSDAVPLHRLGLEPKLRDALHRLGVEDVGGFRALPAGGLRERFGDAAYRLHRLAHDELWQPLAPRPETPPCRERYDLDPEHGLLDVHGLLFLCKQRLGRLTCVLAAQGQVIAGLSLRLLLEKKPPREESLRPAEPTLDEPQLIDLLRLRLESIRLDDELVGFELHAEAVPAPARQRALFDAPRRDLGAAERALARLRAELGERAVVCAEPREGHLPEARYRWRPLSVLRPPEAAAGGLGRLVRRLLAEPRLLASQRAGPDGWMLGGLSRGPLQNLWGPYVISGGWWNREQHREYYFAETRGGDVLWIYRDRCRGGWFLQGLVE